MRVLVVLCAVAACARGPAYRLAVTDAYEVGEDATVGVHVRALSDDDAELVITRPDASEVRQRAPLDAEVTRIKFAPPVPRPRAVPTFTTTGTYVIELRAGKRVLAKQTVEITNSHLDDLLPDEVIADYKPLTRFTRAKQAGTQHWKTYGAVYEHPFRTDARIQILVEEPGKNLASAWKPYEEDGALGVIQGNNVVVRERSDSVSASWLSGDLIVAMKAPTLADLERGLIGHFLSRFPSKLSAK